MIELEKNILNKAIEAFILGIEIYNKPTIKYRVEGFSFLYAIIAIDKNSDDKDKLIKEIKDINNTHPYTMTRALERINNSLTTKKFNRNEFLLFVNYYELKNQERFCYTLMNDGKPRYYYSQQAIDFIIGEYVKDPENIIQNLKKKLKDGNKKS